MSTILYNININYIKQSNNNFYYKLINKDNYLQN